MGAIPGAAPLRSVAASQVQQKDSDSSLAVDRGRTTVPITPFGAVPVTPLAAVSVTSLPHQGPGRLPVGPGGPAANRHRHRLRHRVTLTFTAGRR